MVVSCGGFFYQVAVCTINNVYILQVFVCILMPSFIVELCVGKTNPKVIKAVYMMTLKCFYNLCTPDSRVDQNLKNYCDSNCCSYRPALSVSYISVCSSCLEHMSIITGDLLPRLSYVLYCEPLMKMHYKKKALLMSPGTYTEHQNEVEEKRQCNYHTAFTTKQDTN